jgi:hypothetical protein
MHDFNFNFSPVDEHFGLILTNQLIRVIRYQARLVLTPFFRIAAIRINNDTYSDHKFPEPSDLAKRIIYVMYRDGKLNDSIIISASKIARAFVQTLSPWQKECLALYFCTNEVFINQINVSHLGENTDKVIGKHIIESIHSLLQNEEKLSGCIVGELKHLQDIFSLEDIDDWRASSIANANESFESYVGTSIKLIPLPIDDFEYWENRLGPIEG